MPSETTPQAPPRAATRLTDAITRARDALLREQRPDGHFVFELEADATIPAEYVLLEHYLDRIDDALQRRIGVYLRDNQGSHGGWPLYFDGPVDLSCSVKAYFALKAIGDDPDMPHMRRARATILAAGGAERSNVFTRVLLALFGQVPWRAVPVMPAELMLAPRWFPITLWRVSYWSRTVIVPLLVLMARKPRARNPRRVAIPELFRTPPDAVRDWIRGPYRSAWGHFFTGLDSLLRVIEPRVPRRLRRRAIEAAVAFVRPRLNGEDGLGGIFPAMANTVMMFDTLGYPPEHPDCVTAWSSVRKLLVDGTRSYCQPCLSPVWDTALAGHALAEAALAVPGESGAMQAGPMQAGPVQAACAWLRPCQVTDLFGDWAEARPGVPPGGWAFQYANAYYPDVDDTAVVGMLLHRIGDPADAFAIARARDWILGMQCRGGGWGAFDADNDHQFLNHIPFADHGALLDPPTADVTARCVSFLCQIGEAETAVARAIAWLRREQETDGSWFGRWGSNYLYGTWSVLCALNAAGVAEDDPMVRRAVDFLLDTQREDGGWGEDEASYAGAPHGRYDRSTASQTAWALLGLIAAGQVEHPAVAHGIGWLQAEQRDDGGWDELPYTAVGFPRVFYLRYHGYRSFFPLFALARFHNLARGNARRVAYGF